MYFLLSMNNLKKYFFFFSSRRRHTRYWRDWSSDVCSSDLDEPIRVWSAGCATGEEACTIAMVLCEALGEEEYRRRVKIYATDVDEDALNVARQATYAPAAV